MLQGNGNFLERALGRTVVTASPWHEPLAAVARRSLSRRVHRHYRGFALNQLRLLEREPTIKKLLYVLRTALTGTHLLATGELEADLARLIDRYDLGAARALIAAKQAGERTAADPALLDVWRPLLEQVLAGLDAAREGSVLPEEPAHAAEAE